MPTYFEDITKVGPQGLKGIRNSDLYDTDEDEVSELEEQYRSQALRQRFNQVKSNQYGFEALDTQNGYLPQSGNFEYGTSRYDKGILVNGTPEEVQNQRAEEQPWYAKIGAGMAKGAITAGTTFIDGTAGLLVGAITATAEGRWSGFWDNPLSKAMQNVKDWSEKAMPNYYSVAEQEDPWYQHIFSANFLGDKFIKNLGFTIGAFYSGNVFSAGLRATKLPFWIGKALDSTKAPAITSSLVGSFMSAVNEGRVEAIENSRDWYNLYAQKLNDYKITDQQKIDAQIEEQYNAIIQEYENNKGRALIPTGEGGFTDPAYQIMQEKLAALEQNRTARLSDLEKSYSQAMDRLEQDRLKMGNADWLMNLPILMASNMIEFGRAYAGGFRTARKNANIFKNAETGKYETKGVRRALGITGATLQNALAEGTEEITQKMAQVSAGDYYSVDVDNFYKAKTDPTASQEQLSWSKAVAQGIMETLEDTSSWEEFFIGSLTGALGVPTFRSTRNAQGQRQFPVRLEGGIVGGIREYNERKAREDEIVTKLNERLSSPDFLNYYQGNVRHRFYQDKMDQAILDNNEFDYKNAEHAQLISDIIMFDNAGKLDDLIELINSTYDTSDENLQAIAEQTTTENEDGTKSGPFVDSNGNYLFATPDGKKEMIEKLTQTRDDTLQAIEDYRELKDKIDIQTGEQFSDDQLAFMTWMSMQIDNWDKRANVLGAEVKKSISKILQYYNQALLFWQNVRNKEGQEHAELTDLYKMADERIQQFEKGISNLQILRDLQDEQVGLILSSPTNTEMVESLMEAVELLDEEYFDSKNPNEKQEMLTKLQDIVKIGKAKETYRKKLKEFLDNPGKLSQEFTEIDEQLQEEETNKEREDIRTRLQSATNVHEFARIFQDEEDRDLANEALKVLEGENNKIAQEFSKRRNYYSAVRTAILNSTIEDDQVIQDALTLLDLQDENTSILEELANPALSSDLRELFEEVIEDGENAASRYNEALYELQQALTKVNADEKVKKNFDSLDALQEVTNSTVNPDGTISLFTISRGRRLPEKAGGLPVELTEEEKKANGLENTTDIRIYKYQGQNEKGDYVYSASWASSRHTKGNRTNGTVTVNHSLHEVIGVEKGSDETLPFVPSTKGRNVTPTDVPIADLSSVEVKDDNKEISSLSKGSKESDTDPELAVLTQKGKDGSTRYLYYIPIIPKFDINAVKEWNFETFDKVRKSQGEDFDSIYEYLVDAGAFDFVDNGGLKLGTKLGFMIDPDYEAEKPQGSVPTIFFVVASGANKGQVVGSLPESNNSILKYSGMFPLVERIRKEYSEFKKEQPLESSFESNLHFTKTTKRYVASKDASQKWQKDIVDLKSARDGWGEKNGLIYYKESANGITYTLWFKEPPAAFVRKQVERIFKEGKTLEEAKVQLLEALNKENSKFISKESPVKVSRMMVGKVPYSQQERTLREILKDEKGNYISGQSPIFAIVKNGRLSTNKKINNDDILKPQKLGEKNGRLYLLIPSGAGKYVPVAVRVKHFNKQEFDLDADTEFARGLKAALQEVSGIADQASASRVMEKLVKYLYLGDVMANYFTTENGQRGVTFSRKKRDKDGNYIYDKEGHIVEEKEGNNVWFTTVTSTGQVKNETAAHILNQVIGILQKFNLPIQVSEREINTGSYNDSLIDADVLSSNLERATVEGNWFITEYMNADGKPQKVVTNFPDTRSQEPDSSKATRGQQLQITSTVLTKILSKQGFTDGVIYVNTKTNTITDSDGNEIKVDTDTLKLLKDLAWAAETNQPNLAMTPTNKLLDRSAQRYATASQIKKFKEAQKKEKKDITNRKKSVTKDQSAVEDTLAKIAKNQEKVDRALTDSDSYTILEEDGQYHKYKRIHSVLGENSVSRKALTQKQKDLVNKIGADLSKIAELKKGSRSKYISQLNHLERQYRVDLGAFYEASNNAETREKIKDIISKRLLNSRSLNSVLATERGTAVDTVIRDFFVKGADKVEKPDVMTDKAFRELMDSLVEIKENLEASGETFYANNIVVFQKYTIGNKIVRIAGELDILAVDKDGNFKIYDIKTSKYSFRGNKYFEEKQSYQYISTKAYYTLQLSAYKNLFESQYGKPITTLGIMPIVLNYDNESNQVEHIVREAGMPIPYNPQVSQRVPNTSNLNATVEGGVSTEDMPSTETENTAEAENTTDTSSTSQGDLIFNKKLESKTHIDLTQDEREKTTFSQQKHEIGFFEKGGKLYKGVIVPVATIDGIPIRMIAIRDTASGTTAEGTKGKALIEKIYIVLPNGIITPIPLEDGSEFYNPLSTTPESLDLISGIPYNKIRDFVKQFAATAIEDLKELADDKDALIVKLLGVQKPTTTSSTKEASSIIRNSDSNQEYTDDASALLDTLGEEEEIEEETKEENRSNTSQMDASDVDTSSESSAAAAAQAAVDAARAAENPEKVSPEDISSKIVGNWNSLDKDIREQLSNKGYTEKVWNRLSEDARRQATSCIDF